MTPEQFAELLKHDESSALEFKKSLADSDRIGQTICAFANSGGGQIVFGVHKQGKTAVLAGIENTDNAHQELQNRIFNGCRPEPAYALDTVQYEGKAFIILTIQSFSLQEVCSFKRTTSKRVGSVNVDLSGQDLVHFLRERGMLSFEELPSPATLQDVSTAKVDSFIQSRGTSLTQYPPINVKIVLESLGVATSFKEFSIKKAALLFFAKDITTFQRNCEVRIVKYKGTEASLETKQEDILCTDTIPELLKKTFSTIMQHIGTITTIKEGQRQEMPVLPPEVVREAVTNAIGHRDYIDPNSILVEIFDDRIQITNPGSLLPGQTLKNFAETRRHRNPIIHKLINDCGWGEGLYFGVKSMRKLQRLNNLPDPEFQDLGGYFRVILYTLRSEKKRKAVDYLNERQSKAIAYLEKHNHITAKEYATITGVSPVTAVKDLNELINQDKLQKIGKYRGAHYITKTG